MLVALSTQEEWSDAEVAVLLASTVEQYERLFRAARGDRLGLLVTTSLRFAGADGHEAEVGRRAQEALRRIAADGPLNAWRIRRYLRL